MTKQQAQTLLHEMKDADYHGEVRRIGDGSEYVIIIADVWLWSRADWKQYKRGTLEALEMREQEKELVS